MMERILEQQQAIAAALCLLDTSDLLLDSKDLKEATMLLKPFEVTTREMSEEKHVSISKFIPLLTAVTSSLTPKLAEAVTDSLHRRFVTIESV